MKQPLRHNNMPEIVFKGKEYVCNHHLTVPYRPLVVDQAKGIGPADLGSNLVIHGDNLHALKSLLPRYAGHAFADESLIPVDGLELVGQAQSVVCDLVFEGDWIGTLNARQFQPGVI